MQCRKCPPYKSVKRESTLKNLLLKHALLTPSVLTICKRRDIFNVTLHCLSELNNPGIRDDICQKHHKQRLCEIVITRVKVHFVDVF